ncbi:MAG: NADP-dependent malic enzyme, partial [Bacteriovoracaceae bacterium]|nr:NADP-dependent malic enzyme [Bacteriovoracaceae bacterium]
EFMVETSRRTLADAMKDADAFIGCSAKGVLTKDMVKTMAKNPIIFAMANPHPEILPEEVAEVRDDAIMATGRSDYPNQVNNVLGFPFIFRGALDVRASKINEEMKLAAIYALASLAKEEVPEDVRLAYGNEEFKFGRNYLIPKPFDKRVLTKLAPAVAKAAMDSGVARIQIADLNLYAQQLEERLGTTAAFVRSLKSRISVKQKPRIAFAEGISERVLRAVSIVSEHNIVTPVLLGKKEEILERMDRFGMPYLKNLEIVTPETDNRYEKFSDELYHMRQRKGISWTYARELMTQENYFGSMLVKNGFVDGMITGVSQNYPECFRAIASVIPTENHSKACGTIILAFKNRVVFLADCTVQVDPNGEELSDIAIASSNLYKKLMLKDPRVAFLSFSNFGSSKHPRATKMLEAVELTRKKAPNLTVDGEMQADVAVNEFLMRKMFDFSVLDKPADVLIFPDLASANIAYKLLVQLGKAISVGPIITSMQKAINIVQRTSTVEEIVNMTTVTALMAQEKKI